MLILRSGTRMIQTIKNIKDKDYTLYNTQIGKEIIINKSAAALLQKISTKEIQKNTQKRNKNFFDDLISLGFLIYSETEEPNVFLAKSFKAKYPLSSLTLEITDACNLNCIHCYGVFSKSNSNIISFSWIKDNIDNFNKLNVKTIGLTGGETTLHKDFICIFDLLIKKGFNIILFSNGYNKESIRYILETYKNYNYTIKISLDGDEYFHIK